MSDTEELERITRLLEEIRENQKTQLERQAESLSLQKEQYQVVLKQHGRAMQIQERVEAVQEKSARLVTTIRRFVPFGLAAVVVLILSVTWLLLRFLR